MQNCISDLTQKDRDYLQELIQVNIDSRDNFLEAVEHLKSDPYGGTLQTLFATLAGQRAAQASELQGLVAANNREAPVDSGSMAAVAHRTWMNLREAFGGGEQALLDESERGEDRIKAKYEEALTNLESCACAEILRKHYASITTSHDRIRTLRDQCANSEYHHV